ncbi:hypothetical protein [Rhodococcus sp. IEGM 1408]|uniref:hypothetical protein n=1 Tax=Rhodococcus sp. IEGM 1408 TaxID=3082220 RepID=UPI002954600B|nr:hypothetical protein [Rhodococcus sp. IEGM 1408]MDV8002848.1 hypothetical protein [Rhodococcus sp. IEGM 1408]
MLAAPVMELVLAQVQPPTSPMPIVNDAWAPMVAAVRYVKWVCMAIAVAGVMAIGALLVVDNRLVDQYGPSIQAILIKVVVGLLVIAISAQVAELFVN